jgi:hypothetical protein
MKARNVLTGEIFEAERRTDVSSSSYGQPVLCIKHKDGRLEPVDDWAFEVVEEGDARPSPINRRKKKCDYIGDLFDPRD